MKYSKDNKQIQIERSDACYSHLKEKSFYDGELPDNISLLYKVGQNDIKIRLEIAQLLIWQIKSEHPIYATTTYDKELDSAKELVKQNEKGFFDKLLSTKKQMLAAITYNADNPRFCFDDVINSIKAAYDDTKVVDSNPLKMDEPQRITKNFVFFSNQPKEKGKTFNVIYGNGYFYISGEHSDLMKIAKALNELSEQSILNNHGVVTTANIETFEKLTHDLVKDLIPLLKAAKEADYRSEDSCSIS